MKKAIPFTLLSRDTRGRFEARQLLVPKENTIAVKLSLAEEAQRREKEILKQRVLELESLNADNDVILILCFYNPIASLTYVFYLRMKWICGALNQQLQEAHTQVFWRRTTARVTGHVEPILMPSEGSKSTNLQTH